MAARSSRARDLAVLIALIGVIALYALPTLAASPSPGASAAPAAASSAEPSAKPERSKEPKPAKADKAKAPKAPEVAVTVSGVVGARTDSDGDPEYTLTRGGIVLILDAGPAWFHKDRHPLARYVGKSVTVVGEQRTGSPEVDVISVDGTALRAPGKPPWAGGWKRVGKDHPGWTQEKWDRWQAKARERGLECFPPGQCKDKTKADKPTASGAPSGD